MSATLAPQARSRAGGARRGASARARSESLPILILDRIRWDRVGRIALLLALLAIVYLYLSAGVRIFSTYRQEHADRAAVAALAREYAALEQRHRQLSEQSTIEAQARRLGMARPGEQQYVITGLPAN